MSKEIGIWGDSIVYGAGDLELGGWVNRLALNLRKQDRDYRVYNVGISGEISEEVLDRFQVEAKAREPEIIIFAIGINDTQYLIEEDRVRVNLEKFKSNINQLINQARKFTDKIIFLNCIPVDEDKTNPIPWHANIKYNNDRIEIYNKVLDDIVGKEKLELIDINNIFQSQKDYKKLLHDGLHPNSKGHELIFNIVKDKLSL